MRSIAVLASGGDAPGMNACIRAVTRTALSRNAQVWGIQDGFNGLINQQMVSLTSRGVAGILQHGGSILGAGRCEAFFLPSAREASVDFLRDRGVEGLIVIGGDGSLRGAREIHRLGFPVVTIPGTIDNDMAGTERSIGSYTAVDIATEAIDRLRSTASSHHRAMIVEVMGRNSGYIAVMAGIASGAEMIITPERSIEIQDIFHEMADTELRGKRHFIIVLAEGASCTAHELARLINEAQNPYEARYTTLGYVQRGGTPSALDRILATRMGMAAVEAVQKGDTGVLVALRQNQIVIVTGEESPHGLGAWNDELERAHEATIT